MQEMIKAIRETTIQFVPKGATERLAEALLSVYARATGIEYDDIDAQASDLIADLLVLVDADGVDREHVIDRAREHSDESIARS